LAVNKVSIKKLKTKNTSKIPTRKLLYFIRFREAYTILLNIHSGRVIIIIILSHYPAGTGIQEFMNIGRKEWISSFEIKYINK